MLVSIKKELIEGIRTYKFLSIGAVLLFFAILNPIINKVILPQILETQFNGIDESLLSMMVINNQADCLKAFMGDIFEIGTLVIVLVTSGLVAGEKKEGTFILPLCSNKKFETLLGAKSIVYCLYIFIFITISLLVDYFYAGYLFGFEIESTASVLESALYLGIYYALVVNLVILTGTFFKNTIATAAVSLITIYGSHLIFDIFDKISYTPSKLFENALAINSDTDSVGPIAITLLCCIVLFAASLFRMKKISCR